MKPTLDITKQIHYVDESDFIKFVETNSDYEWNFLCDALRSNTWGVFSDEGKVLWTRKDVMNLNGNETYITEEGSLWLKHFFNTHTWINEMMIVFDD